MLWWWPTLVQALLLPGAALRRASIVRSPPPLAAVFSTSTIPFDGQTYTVKVQESSQLTGSDLCPPIVCIPPVGVGITRSFYDPLHREWAALGAPAELHTPDLLGNGDAQPKQRRFYPPEVWASQLLAYINGTVKRPVILLSQGGLLPVALEMWRTRRTDSIVGASLVSPPPLRFFAPSADAEPGVRKRFSEPEREGVAGASRRAKPPGRTRQRLLWSLAASPVGNGFFRYLRAGDGQPRIRSFSERNLFNDASAVDDEWMRMCSDGAADARSRFATLAYLCGTVPGGAWRDDRSELLASLDVPTQVLRGDAVINASTRLATFVDAVPNPSCCELIGGGRAVLPYENADQVATSLVRFLADNYDPKVADLIRG